MYYSGEEDVGHALGPDSQFSLARYKCGPLFSLVVSIRGQAKPGKTLLAMLVLGDGKLTLLMFPRFSFDRYSKCEFLPFLVL